jgi:hypothetical protein
VFVLLASRVSSLEMNHDFSCISPVIRHGHCHEMKCQKESVKKWHRKVSNFTFWSVNGIQGLVNVLKGGRYNSRFFCDTAVSSLFDGIILHSRRKSLKSFCIHLDDACLLNVLIQQRSSGYRTRLTARTLHQVTSSFLV